MKFVKDKGNAKKSRVGKEKQSNKNVYKGKERSMNKKEKRKGGQGK